MALYGQKKFYQYHINLKVDYSHGFRVGLEPKDGWRETTFCFDVKCTCGGGIFPEGRICTGHDARIVVPYSHFNISTTEDPPRRCIPLTGSELTVLVFHLEMGGAEFDFEPSVDLRWMRNEWVSVMKHSNFRYGKLIKSFQLTNGRFRAPPPTWEDPEYGFHFDMADWKNDDCPEIVVSGRVEEKHRERNDTRDLVFAGWDAPPRSVRDWPKLFEVGGKIESHYAYMFLLHSLNKENSKISFCSILKVQREDVYQAHCLAKRVLSSSMQDSIGSIFWMRLSFYG